jgi:hypothetical protein
MATVVAFLGMLLLSLVVALLVALQLGDFFGASDEFPLVIAAVAGFPVVTLVIFAVAYATAPHARMLGGVALLLVLLAFVPLLPTGLVQRIADHSTNPFTVGMENIYIKLELIIPALAAVLTQWGLVRRRFLRDAGVSDLGLWPWVTTVVAGLVILNPIGLAFVAETLRRQTSEFLWHFTASVTGAVVAVLLVMAWIECYIRDRMLRRRPPAPSAEEPPAQESTHG